MWYIFDKRFVYILFVFHSLSSLLSVFVCSSSVMKMVSWYCTADRKY